MKELRCILFTEREVATAVIERRRRVKEQMPVGTTVERVTFEVGPSGTTSIIHLVADDGLRYDISVGEAETASALVAYCLTRKVPLPVDADKFLQVINNHLALMVRVNFSHKKKSGS